MGQFSTWKFRPLVVKFIPGLFFSTDYWKLNTLKMDSWPPCCLSVLSKFFCFRKYYLVWYISSTLCVLRLFFLSFASMIHVCATPTFHPAGQFDIRQWLLWTACHHASALYMYVKMQYKNVCIYLCQNAI